MGSFQKQQFAFQSDGMRARDAFEQWQREISATHEVTLAPDDAFRMDCAFTRVGPLVISRGEYSGQTFLRNRDNLRRDHLDQCGVFVQPAGERIVFRDGAGIRMQTWDLRLFDLAQEDHSITTGGTSASIYLPRDLMESVIPDFSRTHGRLRSDPAARLLAQHVMAMPRYLPHLPVEELADFVESTLELVFNTLELPADPAPINAATETQLRRMERFIERNLHDPDLDPAMVARAFGMSRSAVYRVFAGHGGIARFIKQRRLARAHNTLRGASPETTVTSLVESFGYRSSAHFWRNFREEFGYAPGELRARTQDDPISSALSTIFQKPVG